MKSPIKKAVKWYAKKTSASSHNLILPPLSEIFTKGNSVLNEMIVKDFENIYNILMVYMEERNTAVRLSLFILSVPYLVGVALLTVKVFTPADFMDFSKFPEIAYWLIGICGIFGVVPLHRFIELTEDQARCSRNINFFRAIYHSNINNEIKKGWNFIDLPIDHNYPFLFRPLSWSGMYIAIISIANTLYFGFGAHHIIFSKIKAEPWFFKLNWLFWTGYIFLTALFFAFLYGYYTIKGMRHSIEHTK